MPISHRIDSGIVVLVLEGEYSADDLIHAIQFIVSDASMPSSPKILIDLQRSASIKNRSPKEILHVVSFFKSIVHTVGEKIAFAVSNDVSYGLIRMGLMLTEEPTIEARVFRSFDEAFRWITE